ncbi:MAG: hypothetical protein Q9227_009091 [Pyrenula ochraceoflavens]
MAYGQYVGSQTTWPKKLADSRNAYQSLKGHFLKFIDHPDDLQSSIDPLADDDNSPWANLRLDEATRAEIFQDVERCFQDNYFFREPATQKKLLDILFVYAKLNPDIGYRQGMHELLAPLLWVVQTDAIDTATQYPQRTDSEEDTLMMQALNLAYVEDDAFSLFCAVMQTAKSFYETGDSKDSSPVVSRAVKIHDELLQAVDPELADYMERTEILPQIYLVVPHPPMTLVQDGLFLRDHFTKEAAASLVAKYSGRRPKLASGQTREGHRVPQKPSARNLRDYSSSPSRGAVSPNRNAARLPQQQKTLETLFQEVTGGLQRRTENWKLAKTVRGAVGEVRKNVNNITSSPGSPRRVVAPTRQPLESSGEQSTDSQLLAQRVQILEARNKVLAKMLGGALESLRSHKDGAQPEDVFNISLAKIQFVQVYLEEPDIPIPPDPSEEHSDPTRDKLSTVSQPDRATEPSEASERQERSQKRDPRPSADVVPQEASKLPSNAVNVSIGNDPPLNHQSTRPSLAQSSFSWMLGADRHRSSFISSVTVPPEQERDSASKGSGRSKALFKDGRRESEERKSSESEEEEITMNNLQSDHTKG